MTLSENLITGVYAPFMLQYYRSTAQRTTHGTTKATRRVGGGDGVKSRSRTDAATRPSALYPPPSPASETPWGKALIPEL